MRLQWKWALLAIVALGLAATAFVLSSDSVEQEANATPNVQEEWDMGEKQPHFPKVRAKRGEEVWEFTLNSFVVEAVFAAPSERPRLVREMRRRVGELASLGWTQEVEEVDDMWQFLSEATDTLPTPEQVPLQKDRVKVAWGELVREANPPKVPEICIKLRSCRIVCERD